MDVLRTGAFAKAGIRTIGIAAHPEDHPLVATGILDAALIEKADAIAGAGHDIFIVTQFAFEAAPILARLRRIRQAGISAPVRIGIRAFLSTWRNITTDSANPLARAVRT